MLDLLSEYRSTEGFNPALGNAVVGALGNAVWNHSELVESIADARSDAVDLLVDVVGRSLRNVLARLPDSIDDVQESEALLQDLRNLESPYENSCKLLLGLLRLRGSRDVPRLKAGSAEFMRLGRIVRRIDSLLVGVGRDALEWPPPFELQVPDRLNRMSELGYATSTYLVGYEEPVLRVVE
jgi:hypothetical protein